MVRVRELGKSHFIAQKLVIKALNDPGRRIVCCRRYSSTILQTVWQNFINTLMFFKIYDRCDINKTERVIKLPNGSELIFMGLDDELKLLSLTNISDFFIEEVFEVSEDIVNQINLRLRGKAKNKSIIMAFNPVSRASWLYGFLNDPNKRPSSIIVHESTYKDNKFLDQEYINELLELERTNPHNFRIYVLNQWGVPLQGLVLANHKVEDFDIDKLVAENNNLQLRIGADFGWIDPSTVVMSLWDKENKKIYVIKEFYKPKATLEEIARAIEKMGCGKTPIYCDSSDPRSIDWLQTQGINAKKSHKHNGSNELYIQFLQNHEIICHSSCIHTAEDLENFSYAKDRQGQYIDGKYTHEFSHCIDAIKYSFSDVYRNRKLKSYKIDLGL